jgi:hypothetical protein
MAARPPRIHGSKWAALKRRAKDLPMFSAWGSMTKLRVLWQPAKTGPRGWGRFTDGEGSFLGDLGGGAWDLITAGSPMVRGAVEGAIGFTPEQTQAYEGARDSRRDALASAQDAHPLSTLAGGVGGGIAQAVLSRGALSTPTYARGALVGAGMGGAYGFGSGESMDDRLSSAGIGALVGAPAAVLGQAAVSGIGNALSGVARRVMPSAFSNPERRAVDRVTRRLVQDRVSPAQARQSIADMRAVGVERPSIMEASPSVRGLGRVIADQPGDMVGDSGRRFGDFIETRMQDMPGAIRGQLDDAFIPQSYRLTFPDEVVGQYETAVRQQAGPFFPTGARCCKRAEPHIAAIVAHSIGSKSLSPSIIGCARPWHAVC